MRIQRVESTLQGLTNSSIIGSHDGPFLLQHISLINRLQLSYITKVPRNKKVHPKTVTSYNNNFNDNANSKQNELCRQHPNINVHIVGRNAVKLWQCAPPVTDLGTSVQNSKFCVRTYIGIHSIPKWTALSRISASELSVSVSVNQNGKLFI